MDLAHKKNFKNFYKAIEKWFYIYLEKSCMAKRISQSIFFTF